MAHTRPERKQIVGMRAEMRTLSTRDEVIGIMYADIAVNANRYTFTFTS